MPAGNGRGGTERRPEEEPGLPDAVVAPRRPPVTAAGSAGGAGPLVAAAHRAGTASSTRSTSGNAEPNSRPASAWNVAGSPVVSWTWPASGVSAASPGLEPVDVEQLGQRRCGGGRRVDDRDVVAGDPGDDLAQQRVVGAAQEERVDRRAGRSREDRVAGRVALAEQRRERVGDRGLGGRTAQVARLDERDERRRRVLVDLDRRVLVLDRPEVGVRADRGRRRDDADPAVARGQRGRRGARPDDAQDRQVVAPAERPDGDRGGRVAGDDDRLDVALGEPVERLRREREDLLVGSHAVGRPGVVAEVERRFARRAADDLAQDRQAADPGVEDPDRTRVGHRGLRTARPRPRRAPS